MNLPAANIGARIDKFMPTSEGQKISAGTASDSESAVVKKTVKKSNKPRKNNGLISILITVLVAALITGGVIYAWQKKAAQKTVAEVKSQTEVEKMDFEKRIENLKSKLTGTETANVELQKTLEDLKKKAELLIGAKKEYKDATLGLSFEYPASFGSVSATSSVQASGTLLQGHFDQNEKLVFNSVSAAYEKSGTSSISLSELKGFAEKRGKIYLLGPNKGQEFEIKPAKTIETGKGQAVLIDKNSFVISGEGDGVPVEIGGDVAVIVNTGNKEYPAAVFVDSDFSLLPLQDFIKMIESIK